MFYVSFTVSVAAGTFQSKDKEESVFLAAMADAVRLFYIIWRKSEIFTFKPSFITVSHFGSLAVSKEKILPYNITYPWKNNEIRYWVAFKFL